MGKIIKRATSVKWNPRSPATKSFLETFILLGFGLFAELLLTDKVDSLRWPYGIFAEVGSLYVKESKILTSPLKGVNNERTE